MDSCVTCGRYPGDYNIEKEPCYTCCRTVSSRPNWKPKKGRRIPEGLKNENRSKNYVSIPERLIEDLMVAEDRVRKRKWEYGRKIISKSGYIAELEGLSNGARKIEEWVKTNGYGYTMEEMGARAMNTVFGKPEKKERVMKKCECGHVLTPMEIEDYNNCPMCGREIDKAPPKREYFITVCRGDSDGSNMSPGHPRSLSEFKKLLEEIRGDDEV